MGNIGGLTECQHGTPGPGAAFQTHAHTHKQALQQSKGAGSECQLLAVILRHLKSLGLQMIHVLLML